MGRGDSLTLQLQSSAEGMERHGEPYMPSAAEGSGLSSRMHDMLLPCYGHAERVLLAQCCHACKA